MKKDIKIHDKTFTVELGDPAGKDLYIWPKSDVVETAEVILSQIEDFVWDCKYKLREDAHYLSASRDEQAVIISKMLQAMLDRFDAAKPFFANKG